MTRRLLLLVLVVAGAPLARAAGELHPFPQDVTYAPGTIRPSRQTQTQQDDAVRAYYDQWKGDFLTTDDTTDPSHWRVRFGRTASDSSVTVSEGQGFGMVIVAPARSTIAPRRRRSSLRSSNRPSGPRATCRSWVTGPIRTAATSTPRAPRTSSSITSGSSWS